mgnify:CR=1 FL=1
MEAKTNGKIVVYELVIENQSGLHARPAAAFVKTANNFRAQITVTKDGDSVNGKSIMGVLMLAAEQGVTLKIRTTGADASAAADALAELIALGGAGRVQRQAETAVGAQTLHIAGEALAGARGRHAGRCLQQAPVHMNNLYFPRLYPRQ